MSREQCGHMAAVNSVSESNNIDINPPDTAIARSLTSTLNAAVCSSSKLPTGYI